MDSICASARKHTYTSSASEKNWLAHEHTLLVYLQKSDALEEAQFEAGEKYVLVFPPPTNTLAEGRENTSSCHAMAYTTTLQHCSIPTCYGGEIFIYIIYNIR